MATHRASGLALVTAAIALWDTVYLSRAVTALRQGGEVIPDALLAHLAPLGWQHINLTGDYLWGRRQQLRPGRVQAVAAATTLGQPRTDRRGRVGPFMVRAAKRAFRSVLWRDPFLKTRTSSARSRSTVGSR